MSLPHVKRVDLDQQDTILASSSRNFDLQKLRAIAGMPAGRAKMWKVAKLIAVCTIQYDTNSATLAGAMLGRRFFESISQVQLAPKGWGPKYAFWAGGKALRRRAMYLRGRLATPDPATLADPAADVTNGTARFYLPLDFYRPRAKRGEDYCPSALSIGDGSLQISTNNGTICPGVTWDDVDVKLIAEIFPGDPEIPLITRFQERDVIGTTRMAFNTAPDALLQAFFHLNGSETTATNLEASFTETVNCQVTLGGHQLIEDQTLQELVEQHNDWAMEDEASMEVPALPIAVPLWSDGKRIPVTKPPSAANDGFIEFSADPRDANTAATVPLRLCTDELFECQVGSENVRQYAAANGARGDVAGKRKTISKSTVKDTAKVARVPLKIPVAY